MKNIGIYIITGIAIAIAVAGSSYFAYKAGGNSCCDNSPVAYGTINDVGQRWGVGGDTVNWNSQSISLPSARYEVSFNDFCYRANTHMALVTPISPLNNARLISLRTQADDCKLIIIMEKPELNRTPGHDDWSIYNDLLFTSVAFAVFTLQ